LRRKNFAKAEQGLFKAIQLEKENVEYKKVFALLLIIRRRFEINNSQVQGSA
jgi:hypothetical protein